MEAGGFRVWGLGCLPLCTRNHMSKSPANSSDLSLLVCPPPPLIEMSTFCLIPSLLWTPGIAGLSIETADLTLKLHHEDINWGCIRQVRVHPLQPPFLFLPPSSSFSFPLLASSFLFFPSLHLLLSLSLCLLQALRWKGQLILLPPPLSAKLCTGPQA